MVAEHEGMRLWPRFSNVRLPHVGSHAGADQAKEAKYPICRIREDSEIRTTMKNTKLWEAQLAADHPPQVRRETLLVSWLVGLVGRGETLA